VPKAEVHVLDAGHFALDTAADEIAQFVRNFMTKMPEGNDGKAESNRNEMRCPFGAFVVS
jgi:hypothetical protein